MKSVYLDNAATSRTKPESVYRAMDSFMRDVGASPGRSVHGPGIEASRVVADARGRAARLFGVKDSARIAFMLNCTEALNVAIKGTLKPGDHVVTTSMEHNSVMRPLSAMAAERGVTVTKAPADGRGLTDPDDVAKALTSGTALVVMTHASNVTGAIQPVREVGALVRERGIPLLVDAAQSAGYLPVDVDSLCADMLAFSGHKGLMGPQGTGGLYVREGVDPAPLKHGGTGSRSSEEVHPDMLPDRYESGTPNTPGLAGLAAALGVILDESVEAIRSRLKAVGGKLAAGLKGTPGVTLHGPDSMEENAGVCSFTVAGRDIAAVAHDMEERYGVMMRIGLQCAPSAHRTIGTFPAGTIRASVGYFTTDDDIDYFLESLEDLLGG